MSTIDYVAEIGKRFATLVEETLTPEQFEHVRTLNDARSPGTCATHEYFDANEAMDDAFTEVTRRPANPADNADNVLWSRAWDWAIEHYLSHSDTAIGLEADGYPEARS